MRLFLAIEIEPNVRANVAAVQTRLKASGADVRWVEPENFHLTVKFLGDVPDTLLPEVEAVCESLAQDGAPFRFRTAGGSFFPKRGPNIKTLFVGLTEGADEWRTLAQAAQDTFAPLGIARESGLAPHITLGRVKSDKNLDALRSALSREAQTDCGEQAADEIVLVQSFLDPRGATYKPLRRWPLGGPNCG